MQIATANQDFAQVMSVLVLVRQQLLLDHLHLAVIVSQLLSVLQLSALQMLVPQTALAHHLI